MLDRKHVPGELDPRQPRRFAAEGEEGRLLRTGPIRRLAAFSEAAGPFASVELRELSTGLVDALDFVDHFAGVVNGPVGSFWLESE